MPDARVPFLDNFGLGVVPGYQVDPATGKEDLTWRNRHFAWHENLRDWRLWAQEEFASNAQFREDLLTICSRDCALFNIVFMDIEEPRAIEFFNKSEGLDFDAALAGLNDDSYDLSAQDLSYKTIHPFLPFAYQVDAWRLLTYVILGPLRTFHFDLLWDKARGIGMSYAFLAWAYWAWLFIPGLRGTILTEKWDKAERSNDLNSLFGKLDLFIDATPDAILPAGFKNKGEKGAHRQRGSLLNPDTGSAIFTEPTTADSTRGGREAYVGIDEINFHENLTKTWATVHGTTMHVCGWSSASYRYGRQGERIFENARKHPRVALVRTLDWYENPHQDRIWFIRERERFEASGMAEQFEVEYLRNAAAGSGTLVYKKQLQNIIWVKQGYDRTRPLNMSVDPGTSDFTAFIFWQTHFPMGKKRIRFINGTQLDKVPVYFWAHVMTGIMPRDSWVDADGIPHPPDEAFMYIEQGFFDQGNIPEIMDWMSGVSPQSISLYGDPSMRRVDVTHNSWISIFEKETLRLRQREFGEDDPRAIPIYANFPWQILYKRNNFQDRRAGTREALMMAEFTEGVEGVGQIVEALENTRMQEITERNTRAPGQVHDAYSHYEQATSYGMIWETLELTAEELEPLEVEQPLKTRSLRTTRRVSTPHQRQTDAIRRDSILLGARA